MGLATLTSIHTKFHVSEEEVGDACKDHAKLEADIHTVRRVE
jgi:hypothetical protein